MQVVGYGKTSSGCQRHKCKICQCTYTFHNQLNKYRQERVWFEEWIIEGYSFRQLIRISRRGIWKIKQIISYWLDQPVPPVALPFSEFKYLVFDGTYFRHENCFLLLMDSQSGKAIGYRYWVRENYQSAYGLFTEADNQGVRPLAVTLDGNTNVIRALKAVWPQVIAQRCLVHIQRQGLSWLRRFPKSEAAKELRKIYLTVCRIESHCQKDNFLKSFLIWEKHYGQEVLALPASDKVFGDLQRARSLLINAWPDMFHYLDNPQIAPTSNLIEGYFSAVKGRYKQHHGLMKNNRPKYLSWYIYLKNNS